LAEQDARAKAQDIARENANKFWKDGQTIRSLEMCEASGISPVELLKMHDNLVRASEIRRALGTELKTLRDEMLSQKSHSQEQGWTKCPCASCRAYRSAPQRCKAQIINILGWNENAPVQNNGNIQEFHEGDFMGAARRCLVLIMRMSPSQFIVHTE